MDHLRAMRLFIRVADLGSLTAASTDLGYARGAGSAIVADLERFLGVQLIERTTRRMRLTEDGNRYLDRARDIVAEIERLEDDIGAAERKPRGRLRVQLPPGLARIVVAPALPAFVTTYPDIKLEIVSRGDLPDFVGHGLDAAVVLGPLPELDIVARPVGHMPFMTLASPAYLERRGTPEHPHHLAVHACLRRLSAQSLGPQPWRFRIDGKDVSQSVNGPLAFEAAEAAVIAAVRGAGILQVASIFVYDEVRTGRLIPILDRFRPSSFPINIIHPRHRLKPRKLRVFEDFLVDLNQNFRRKRNIRNTDLRATPSE